MPKAFWFRISLFLLISRSGKIACCFCFQPNFKNLPVLKQIFLSLLHVFKNSLNILLVLRSMFFAAFPFRFLMVILYFFNYFLLKYIILKNGFFNYFVWLIMRIKYLREKNSVKIPEFQLFN